MSAAPRATPRHTPRGVRAMFETGETAYGTAVRRLHHRDVLLWHNHMRLLLGLGVGGAGILCRAIGVLAGNIVVAAIAIGAYTLLVATLSALLRRFPGCWRLALSAAVVADVAVLVVTLSGADPARYADLFILSFLTLLFTEFYFGRAAAVLALVATLAGYAALVGQAVLRGRMLPLGELTWSAGLYVVAAGVFVIIHASMSARIERVATLFLHAEEGDFSGSYDIKSDRFPDRITILGRAYNVLAGQLETLITTDPLTGCLNRRGFEAALTQHVARAARAGDWCAVLALDLDHFKRLNDTRGHVTGDEVLREFGRLLRDAMRAGDTVARTGGEEFTVVAPGVGPLEAAALAQRLCEQVRVHRFPVAEGSSARLTCSVGVAAERVNDDAAGTALCATADAALYAAKRAGRDQVHAATAGAPARPVRRISSA